MKRTGNQDQRPRPVWTREQLEAAQWTPEQLTEARERWNQGTPAGPQTRGKPKTDV